MPNSRTPSATRRTVLRTALATGAAAAGGAAATPATAQSTGLGEWFANTSNYDGVVDERGSDSVSVEVGTQANGGAFGFTPAAVRVAPGTTVTWEWTGEGGSHNVVAQSGAFESELVGEAGHTFEHTFEETGVYRYYCTPHKAMGMKGAVVVGDAAVGGGGDGGSTTESGGDGGSGSTATATGEATNTTAAASGGGGAGGGDVGDAPGYMLLGGGIAAAISPLVFGLLLLLVGDDYRPDPSQTGGYRTDGGSDDRLEER